METILYTIARFTPYSETGEFANIGIVGVSQRTNFFDFKLQGRKYARVTRFFEQIDREIYRTAIRDLQSELNRMKRIVRPSAGQLNLDFASKSITNLLLLELTRRKEGVIRFGEVRMSVADDPAKEVERLYKYYVDKEFVTPQYVEQILERDVRDRLRDLNQQSDYVERRLQDGPYQARFPFVKFDGEVAISAIKPLSFVQERPESIIEHGNKWTYALRRFSDAGSLPNQVLIPVRAPSSGDGLRYEAFSEAAGMLTEAGGQVVDAIDAKSLKSYISRTIS